MLFYIKHQHILALRILIRTKILTIENNTPLMAKRSMPIICVNFNIFITYNEET